MDFLSKTKRSALMATIRGRRNKSTELRLVRIFREYGITGWRRHVALPGRPDFVFRISRVAVFVDGCFWHSCPRCYRRPSTNQTFWDAKAKNNRIRDLRVGRELRASGWKVIRIWEHELNASKRVIARIRKALSLRSVT